MDLTNALPDAINPRLTTSLAVVMAVVIGNFLQRRIIKLPSAIRSPRTETYLSIVHDVISAVLVLSGLYIILNQLNVNLTPIFASAGVLGIIVGLGLRPVLEDFFTASFIFTQDIVRIGDTVEIGGTVGSVDALGFRTIQLRDKSGALHIIPSREIRKIINYSRRSYEMPVDMAVKPTMPVDRLLKRFGVALDQLRAHPDLGKYLHKDSVVLGIQDVKEEGTIIVRTALVTRFVQRNMVARQFRYLVLREFERK